MKTALFILTTLLSIAASAQDTVKLNYLIFKVQQTQSFGCYTDVSYKLHNLSSNLSYPSKSKFIAYKKKKLKANNPKNRVISGEYSLKINEWFVVYKVKCKNTCGTYELIKAIKVTHEKDIASKISEKVSSSFYKNKYISYSIVFKEQFKPENPSFLTLITTKILEWNKEYDKLFPPTEEEKKKRLEKEKKRNKPAALGKRG